LIAAPIIAVLLINFVFQSYEVDGPSMETTLSDSDRLIIWKVPRTISRLTGREYIPNRGDIVVFHKGGLYDRSRSENRQLIKRVIGLPGDRVEVMNGGITIYNSDYPDGFQPDKESGYEIDLQTIAGNNIDIEVPDGELFFVGDNRVNSLDSRSFGTIPADSVVGRLIFRMTPLNNAQRF
jgi:signal peptidase I